MSYTNKQIIDIRNRICPYCNKKIMIKDWDGYLDLPSKRDDKLNQLIK